MARKKGRAAAGRAGSLIGGYERYLPKQLALRAVSDNEVLAYLVDPVKMCVDAILADEDCTEVLRPAPNSVPPV